MNLAGLRQELASYEMRVSGHCSHRLVDVSQICLIQPRDLLPYALYLSHNSSKGSVSTEGSHSPSTVGNEGVAVALFVFVVAGALPFEDTGDIVDKIQ